MFYRLWWVVGGSWSRSGTPSPWRRTCSGAWWSGSQGTPCQQSMTFYFFYFFIFLCSIIWLKIEIKRQRSPKSQFCTISSISDQIVQWCANWMQKCVKLFAVIFICTIKHCNLASTLLSNKESNWQTFFCVISNWLVLPVCVWVDWPVHPPAGRHPAPVQELVWVPKDTIGGIRVWTKVT